MRFLVLVKANGEGKSDGPSAGMKAFNNGLARDGVMLVAEGLQPSAKGARITYASGARPAVVDGPFTESKELIAGFWILQARSKDELVERLTHCPFENGESVEIRQLFDAEDFPDLKFRLKE